MSNPPTIYEIPANTPLGKCRSCHAPVFWITTKLGKPMPVDADVHEGKRPTWNTKGCGISHFITCPNADQHRKKKIQPELPL